MLQKLHYAPDIDQDWRINPGVLTRLDNYAPVLNGSLYSVGDSSLGWTITKTGCNLNAYIFRKVDGTYRFLTFGTANIDEYDNVGTRTNRATGLTATGWQACAFGDAIIACDYATATQVSTGAGFSALSGSPPKAKLCCVASPGFVMLGNYNDGTATQDGWWCSALNNYTSWTASASTQAANGRLLDAPGPLTAMVAYRNLVVAFKSDAIFVGEYVGPPVIWSWRMVSNRVGCVGPDAVVEAGGILYFMHSSGFYAFDGSSMPKNIGKEVFKTALTSWAYLVGAYASQDSTADPGVGASLITLDQVSAIADDVDNIVWFNHYYNVGSKNKSVTYGYNYLNGTWGRMVRAAASGTPTGTERQYFIKATTSSIGGFGLSRIGRGLFVNSSDSAFYLTIYPYPTGGLINSQNFVTGIFGDENHPTRLRDVYVAQDFNPAAAISSSSAFLAVSSYAAKGQAATMSVNATYNSTELVWDVNSSGNLHSINYSTTSTASTAKKIAGLEVHFTAKPR